MNFDQEKYAFNKFLELYKKLPMGEKSESPDFLIKTDNGTIGVELTEIINERTKEYEPAQIYSLEGKITEHAKNEFTKLTKKKLLVSIEFRDNLRMNNGRIKELGQEIAQLLYNQTLYLPDNELCYNGEVKGILPRELSLISFDVAPLLNELIWQPIRQKFIENLEAKHLNKVIEKKEKLISVYRTKADKIFLLMTKGFIPNSWYGDFIDRRIKDSQFDKVFLLRIMTNELIELQ